MSRAWDRRHVYEKRGGLGTFASKSLLIVRVVLGVIFFAHGAQKVFGCFGGPALRGVIGYFKQTLGLPAPLTVLAAFIEGFGAHSSNGVFINWSLEPGHGARFTPS